MNTQENNAFSNISLINKSAKAPIFFIEKALGWKVYLDKILANEDTLRQLESINYSKESIKEQHKSINSLIASLENYHNLIERKKELTKIKNETLSDINRDYSYHRNLIANLFNLPEQVIRNNGPSSIKREEPWLREIADFYLQILHNETAMYKLSGLNIQEESLTDTFSSIKEIEKINDELANINLELDELSSLNAEIKKNFDKWIAAFKEKTENILSVVH